MCALQSAVICHVFYCDSILSPCDEASSHGGPGDAAGVGLLALLLFVLAAAAQAAQVDGQTQQVEAEPRSRHAAQEYERLQGEGGEKEGGNDRMWFSRKQKAASELMFRLKQ